MIQQFNPATRVGGTARRVGAPPKTPLPDPAQAWKGGRTLIRLVDITVRQHAATAANEAAPATVAPTTQGQTGDPPMSANVASKPVAPPRAALPPLRKTTPAESSLQPLIVLGLIGLIFGVLAAAIVTGRSNVEPVPRAAPSSAWRAAPLAPSAGNTVGQMQSAAPGDGANGEASTPVEAPEIELADPALRETAHGPHDERAHSSPRRYPPVARFRGHIEPDTMEARHDQPGTRIH